MRFGITMFATDVSMAVVELALAVQERGFDSLWLPEHTHIPVSRRTPPPTGAPELPEEYRRSLDPLVALSAVAASTQRLRVGTGVLLAAQRDPVVTAKALATLDHLSGGRLTVGVGYGWNEDEAQTHGVPFHQRRAVVRDHVLTMRRLWEDDVAEYEGPHFRLEPSWSWPKPRQRPLPVLIGGSAGPKLFAHIAEWAQGWIPVGGTGMTEALPRLRDQVAAAGRDPATLEVVPVGSVPTPGKLEHFASLGVTEVVLRVPSAPRDEALAVLDAHAELLTAARAALGG